MASLVVGYHVYGGKGNPVGQRIWDDGRVESYLVSKLVKNAQGSYDYVPVPPDWYPTTQISPEQLDEVYTGMREAGVGTMPAIMDTIVGRRTDTTSAIWHVWVETEEGGFLKEIRVSQWGPLAPAAVPLMSLLIQLHQIINSTLPSTS